MMKMCYECDARDKCKKLCCDVEVLLRNKYSLTSNYLVKFVNPFILEEISKVPSERLYRSKINKDAIVNRLLNYVKRLKRTQKFCIVKYYGLFGFDSCTQEKIAEELHISQNTVKYYIQKSIKFLKLKFRKDI